MADIPTREEAREAYEAAMAVAVAMMRAKEPATDLVQEAFERMLTTRPWARAQRTFAQHAMNVVRSLALHARASKAEARDKEAHEGFHREEVGYAAASPEEKILRHAEQEGRQSRTEQELDSLDAALGDNTVARAVLRCLREDGLAKAGDIAVKLGIPVQRVYRANEALREHLHALRKNQPKDDV